MPSGLMTSQYRDHPDSSWNEAGSLDDKVGSRYDENRIHEGHEGARREEKKEKAAPLWTLPNVLLTPHVAIRDAGNIAERRLEVLVDNARRFAADEPLRNVVDEAAWY